MEETAATRATAFALTKAGGTKYHGVAATTSEIAGCKTRRGNLKLKRGARLYRRGTRGTGATSTTRAKPYARWRGRRGCG